MCSPLLRSDTYLPDTMTIYEDTDMGYSMRYRLNSERYPLQHPQYFNHPLLLPLPPLTHRRHFTNSTPPCRHTLHSPPSLTPPRLATLLRNHRVQLTQHPPTRRRPALNTNDPQPNQHHSRPHHTTQNFPRKYNLWAMSRMKNRINREIYIIQNDSY